MLPRAHLRALRPLFIFGRTRRMLLWVRLIEMCWGWPEVPSSDDFSRVTSITFIAMNLSYVRSIQTPKGRASNKEDYDNDQLRQVFRIEGDHHLRRALDDRGPGLRRRQRIVGSDHSRAAAEAAYPRPFGRRSQ